MEEVRAEADVSPHDKTEKGEDFEADGSEDEAPLE